MVGHHVPQRPGLIVVTAALSHADIFGNGYLHVVDVAAVPYRFKDTIGKAEYHDVLHRFLAEVVVDAVYLAFFQRFLDFPVEGARGIDVVSKGFFDNNPPPVSVFFMGESDRAELLDNLRKYSGAVAR